MVEELGWTADSCPLAASPKSRSIGTPGEGSFLYDVSFDDAQSASAQRCAAMAAVSTGGPGPRKCQNFEERSLARSQESGPVLQCR